ncbi:MAG: DJ-1/PfpI family protein [Endomicrobium sp.]|jgi:protease I|uniref:DJ-1/PfpI family protein n=1 Tax=Candidatus Endomicrobiellum cubanum TaxID=3242325 RepID=UPI0028342E68|nr:DJ-1/PfpI family protein [Endomicrobium sp.]
MKKVVFITAPDTFRDEEYYKPKQLLENANIEVVTASTKIGELIGKFGFKANSSLLLEDINPNNFDAIVYIGGAGSSIFFDNEKALNLAREFFKLNKTVASICIAGVILANSGVLKDKKATVFVDGKDTLIEKGAIYTATPLEIYGKIITANGPDIAKDFGEAILKSIKH